MNSYQAAYVYTMLVSLNFIALYLINKSGSALASTIFLLAISVDSLLMLFLGIKLFEYLGELK